MSAGSDDETLSLGRAWSDTAAAIGDRQHARWILEVATGLEGDDWAAGQQDLLTETMVARLDAMIERYLGGEPLQYVLGRWGFRHLDLAIDGRVLIPRPETELVAEIAIDAAMAFSPRRVLDLGTGSGAIGLSIASELPLDDTEVWLTDVSDDALAVARANLAGIGPAAVNVRLAAGDWFEALEGAGAPPLFEVIVSNPPYVVPGAADASVADWEPDLALYGGADGLDAYRAIISGAQGRLSPDGWLILEIGEALGPSVATMLTETGFEHVEIRPDLTGRDRIAIGRAARAAV